MRGDWREQEEAVVQLSQPDLGERGTRKSSRVTSDALLKTDKAEQGMRWGRKEAVSVANLIRTGLQSSRTLTGLGVSFCVWQPIQDLLVPPLGRDLGEIGHGGMQI
ncbi:hypothetical protein ElyMa_001503800 [Elysia marginata]|uniref:Uncharacterized protein n=1 Tax=Elysia marginata TaxID=1093978 RepID=A0AAV4J8G1_9GAST|nr:hypothetical protein ElyMa_001503800 [Elysia marginata]